jgi:hypothetical protein
MIQTVKGYEREPSSGQAGFKFTYIIHELIWYKILLLKGLLAPKLTLLMELFFPMVVTTEDSIKAVFLNRASLHK